MDPFVSGHYWRYQLMIQYLLEIRRISVDSVFRGSFAVPSLEAELRAFPASPLPKLPANPSAL